jgi:hypothetical protein
VQITLQIAYEISASRAEASSDSRRALPLGAPYSIGFFDFDHPGINPVKDIIGEAPAAFDPITNQTVSGPHNGWHAYCGRVVSV